MIDTTGNTVNDINNVTDQLNYLQKRANSTKQLLIQAYEQLDIILTDGGNLGNSYQAVFNHNLGYAPMFVMLYQAPGSNQFIPLPFTDWILSPASIHYTIYPTVDSSNLYATMVFQNSANTPPFFPVDTVFSVYYYLFSNPIVNT